MLIGYMRVSTGEQSLDLQRDALGRAGCERNYEDICSGRAVERPGLSKALDAARQGDALVVWKLDRIGRSLPHVVGLVGDLQKRGVGLKVWNTIYMDAALNQLRAEGHQVLPEDVARLSPLSFKHINMLGRYAFTLPDAVTRGELRPLRNPATAAIDEL